MTLNPAAAHKGAAAFSWIRGGARAAVRQYSRQHSLRRPGLCHVPLHYLRRPVGHDGVDGVREPGTWRIRHGRRVCRRHPDALIRHRFRPFSCHCCNRCRRGERRVRTLSLSPAIQVDRSRAGLAHDRSGVHGDRHRNLYLRTHPEIGAFAGLVAGRRQSRLSLLSELPRVSHRRSAPCLSPSSGTRSSERILARRSAPPSTIGAWRNRSASMSTGCSR